MRRRSDLTLKQQLGATAAPRIKGRPGRWRRGDFLRAGDIKGLILSVNCSRGPKPNQTIGKEVNKGP